MLKEISVLGLCFNFFDFYNKWQKFIENNKDLSVYIVYFEDMRKVNTSFYLFGITLDIIEWGFKLKTSRY